MYLLNSFKWHELLDECCEKEIGQDAKVKIKTIHNQRIKLQCKTDLQI